MMKQLPHEQLRKVIMNLFSRRKIDIQAKEPAEARSDPPADIDEVVPDTVPDIAPVNNKSRKVKDLDSVARNRIQTSVKPRHVSANFKTFLLKYLQSKDFDATAHYGLNPDEKFLFNAIAKYVGFDLNQLNTDDSFAKRWDVILGELEE
jgi:hypothetical protein